MENYVNMDFIIEKYSKTKLPGTNTNEEELIEWTYEAIQLIDNYKSVIHKEEVLYLKEGKVKLPFEIQTIKKIYDANGLELKMSFNGFELIDNNDYIINVGYLYTKAQSPLKIHYSTILLDENDRPLIPDKSYYINAILSYLKYKTGERSYWNNKITDGQFRLLQQDWLFNLPVAIHSPKMEIMNDSNKFAKTFLRHYF